MLLRNYLVKWRNFAHVAMCMQPELIKERGKRSEKEEGWREKKEGKGGGRRESGRKRGRGKE